MSYPKFETFAERLRYARASSGLTQTGLASLAGMKPAQVNRYETGKNVPRSRTLAELSKRLGVEPEWLINGSGPRNVESASGHGPLLQVEDIRTRQGGVTISLTLHDDLRDVFLQRATQEGISLKAYLRNALLELAKERGEGQFETLTKQLRLLVEANARSNLAPRPDLI